MSRYAARVKDTTTTTGTGALTLSGAAPTGYRTFGSAFPVGKQLAYAVASSISAEWEEGYGYISGATTLVRSVVKASSNGGALVNFSAGEKDVFCTIDAGVVNRCERGKMEMMRMGAFS